jgi:mannose-6-phosphate isomerase
MDPLTPVFTIVPTIQHYDWGKVGLASKVAKLVSSDTPHFDLKESTPYAEVRPRVAGSAPMK